MKSLKNDGVSFFYCYKIMIAKMYKIYARVSYFVNLTRLWNFTCLAAVSLLTNPFV